MPPCVRSWAARSSLMTVTPDFEAFAERYARGEAGILRTSLLADLFGYLGYDMVRQMERLPEPNPDALKVPDAIMIRPTVMVVFDAVRDEISVVTPVRPQPGTSAKAAYEGALARLESVAFALER